MNVKEGCLAMLSKWILFLSFIFIIYCEQANDVTTISDASEVPTVTDSETSDVTTEEETSEEEETRERNRLRVDNDRVIRSTLGERFRSTTVDTDEYYDSPPCSEYTDCIKLCDKIARGAERKCYRQPSQLVAEIEEGLFDIINIADAEDVNISAGLFQGILEIDKDIILDLIDDHMSEGDLKSFLVWIAINRSIASVLDAKDRNATIIEKALRELGKLQTGSKNKEAAGLNTGLIGRDSTFLFLASDESNRYAFEAGYKILKDSCSNGETCKLRLLCSRERRRNSRSRRYTTTSCRTPMNSRKRSISDRVCYVHGSSVWSYLYELIDDGDIRENHFEDHPIGVGKCNGLCGSKTNNTCPIIL